MTNRYDKFIQPIEGIEVVSRAPGSRVPPMPSLAKSEFATIVKKIGPTFAEVADRFDERKYPPQVYEHVIAAFHQAQPVSPAVLRRALLWKYGHLHWKSGRLREKSNIPPHHQALIDTIQRTWPGIVRQMPPVPQQAFAEIDRHCGGRTRFITVAFLTHLLFPEEVPIIDQHNFRAVNAFVHGVRPLWLGKKTPTNWQDVQAVRTFMGNLLSAWRGQAAASVPTKQRLDRFLMMYGKALKKAA